MTAAQSMKQDCDSVAFPPLFGPVVMNHQTIAIFKMHQVFDGGVLRFATSHEIGTQRLDVGGTK